MQNQEIRKRITRTGKIIVDPDFDQNESYIGSWIDKLPCDDDHVTFTISSSSNFTLPEGSEIYRVFNRCQKSEYWAWSPIDYFGKQVAGTRANEIENWAGRVVMVPINSNFDFTKAY